MTQFKIRINPITKEIDYTIEGSYEELLNIDLNEIKKFSAKIQKINSVFNKEKSRNTLKKGKKTGATDSVDLTINVPSDLVEAIEQIKDERIKFPILWHYSSKPVMTVQEFLNAVSSTGFSLSSSWLPSVGGNFATMLVSGKKMFKPQGKKGNEKLWELNDVAKLKISSEIKKLDKGKKVVAQLVSEKEFQDIVDRVKNLEDHVFVKKATNRNDGNSKTYDGLTGGVHLLIDQGYFNKLVTVVDIINELKREDYVYSRQAVDIILRRDFVKKKRILTRIQENNVWKYTLRK